MIELEIQALSQTREGLLIDVGGILVAHGFTLLRQRLVQDPHGVLLTVVARGPSRRQRALESALDDFDRFVSFELAPFEPGEAKPHFAATRQHAYATPPPAAPAPAAPTAAATAPRVARVVPLPAAPAIPTVAPTPPAARQAAAPAPAPKAAAAPPVPPPEPPAEEPVFILPRPRAPAPAPAPPAPPPEPEPLGPDLAAVEKLLPVLTGAYPQVLPTLQAWRQKLAPGARAASLHEAGRRLGAWAHQQKYAGLGTIALPDAIARIALPALGGVTKVELHGEQLHIRQSPLCEPDGHSGCDFYMGCLEGLLGPAVAADALSVFGLCCRSCGADECVLALDAGG